MGDETESNSKAAHGSGGSQSGQTDPGATTGQAPASPTTAAPEEGNSQRNKLIARWLSIAIVASAAVLGLIILYKVNYHPRTDDATVLANFIGLAPQVEGPIVQLPIHDNQLVKQGDLLFEIDDRPYRYALENALSEQAALEGQIADQTRIINALKSAVSVAQANIPNAEAEVAAADQGIGRAQADWEYASNDLRRQEALLPGRAVSADDVDKARSTEKATWEALRQSQSQLAAAKAQLISIQTQREQASNAVTTLEPLINQRGARAAAVEKAQYDYNNCRVYAPFDARVTDLLISEGAYAHIGEQLFTLIDVRRWWALANFREGQLAHIKPGMKADIYVMSKPDQRFPGVVESIGFGVTPDADLIGSFSINGGLPDVQRTLNWVHLASRYPVRVRVDNPEADLFRISESAVVIVRGQ